MSVVGGPESKFRLQVSKCAFRGIIAAQPRKFYMQEERFMISVLSGLTVSPKQVKKYEAYSNALVNLILFHF